MIDGAHHLEAELFQDARRSVLFWKRLSNDRETGILSTGELHEFGSKCRGHSLSFLAGCSAVGDLDSAINWL